uniref:Uncharacterized protein n=1 Tax=Streptomyces rochei TaxID=1928 RepID=F2Z8T4_STRRO|nr:hypothetical protein [Streptomyces rochei]
MRRGQDSNLHGPPKESDLETCSLVPDQPLRAPLLAPGLRRRPGSDCERRGLGAAPRLPRPWLCRRPTRLLRLRSGRTVDAAAAATGTTERISAHSGSNWASAPARTSRAAAAPSTAPALHRDGSAASAGVQAATTASSASLSTLSALGSHLHVLPSEM